MGSNLYFLPRQQKAPSCGRDVAPQGRYSETTGFARGAPQLIDFLEKNNTFLRRIPKPVIVIGTGSYIFLKKQIDTN